MSVAPSPALPSSSNASELELAVQEATSVLGHLCSSMEKQAKLMRETLVTRTEMAIDFSTAAEKIGALFPDISEWLETTSSYTSQANTLQTTLVLSLNEHFVLPLNSSLKNAKKELKQRSKLQAKSENQLESSRSKVKQCREKGKQTNMLKLRELEEDQKEVEQRAELMAINKSSALKKSEQILQVDTLESIHNILTSYATYFSRGFETFSELTKQLETLRSDIDMRKSKNSGDLIEYMSSSAEKMNIGNELTISSQQRLAQPLRDVILPPLQYLPEEIRDYFQQDISFAVSTTGKIKNSFEVAHVDFTCSPAVLNITNVKDGSSISRRVNQLLQVCRAKGSQNKLKLHWSSSMKEKETVLLFPDVEQRERFYEYLSFATRCSTSSVIHQEEDLRLWIGSWNMGDTPPPPDLRSWIPTEGFDLYVIGVQECEYKPKVVGDDIDGHAGGHCETDWFGRLQNHLGENFIRVCGLSLTSIRMIVFVHREKCFNISSVRKSTEACGIANIYGNKGAVGVSFYYNETKLAFINSHLAAHMGKCGDRNQNFRQIIENLRLEPTSCYLTNYYHHLFWLGDLNYRIEAEREMVLEMIGQKDYPGLFVYDQLLIEKSWKKTFPEFQEGVLTFPPTYRYCRGSNEYSAEKLRVPSWCDRILWKSLPNLSVLQHEYDSIEDILTSDHHPIFGTFTVETLKPNFPHIPEKPCSVLFTGVTVFGFSSKETIPDVSLSFICPSFYAKQNSVSSKERVPKWDTLPPMELFTTNRSHIDNEFVFVIVSENNKKKESSVLGQAVVSLRGACDDTVYFDCNLQYKGVLEGKLKGFVNISWSAMESPVNALACPMDAINMKGYLIIHKKRKKTMRRFFVLSDDVLYYFESETATKLIGSISLIGAKIGDRSVKGETMFRIESSKKTLKCQANSVEDKQEWISCISAVSQTLQKLPIIDEETLSPVRMEESALLSPTVIISKEGRLSPAAEEFAREGENFVLAWGNVIPSHKTKRNDSLGISRVESETKHINKRASWNWPKKRPNSIANYPPVKETERGDLKGTEETSSMMADIEKESIESLIHSQLSL